MGAVSDFVRKKFGGDFYIETSTPNVGATAGQVASNNDDRMLLVIVNTGGVNAYIAPSGTVGASTGILLAANGGMFETSVDTDGPMPAWDWDAISSGAGTTLFVMEVRRYA